MSDMPVRDSDIRFYYVDPVDDMFGIFMVMAPTQVDGSN